MNEAEGVIKYLLEHDYGPLPPHIDISSINAWRTILFKLTLIGQTPSRYQGLGYGNISRRLEPGNTRFLISGTQTGQFEQLSPEQFAIVDFAAPDENVIHSSGPCKPSSEALTHASVYLHHPNTQAVIHVHCPELWHNTHALNIPHTHADIPYGSIKMAKAVETLLATNQFDNKPIFSMLGHEDGIVCFGNTLEEAAIVLLSQFAKALAIEQTSDSI